jgi:hypothetical protein
MLTYLWHSTVEIRLHAEQAKRQVARETGKGCRSETDCRQRGRIVREAYTNSKPPAELGCAESELHRQCCARAASTGEPKASLVATSLTR